MAAHAQNAIEAVTSSMQSGAEVVRIDLSQPLTAVPAGFAIQTPARIALDFPGPATPRPFAIEVNQGNLRSLNVVQAGERTRLVLNLKQATGYKAEIQGKSLLVVARAGGGNGPRGPAATSSPKTATATPAAARPRLPPGQRQHRPRDRRPAEQPGRRRHPPARQEPGGRVHQVDAA
jgi:hypothetical protein